MKNTKSKVFNSILFSFILFAGNNASFAQVEKLGQMSYEEQKISEQEREARIKMITGMSSEDFKKKIQSMHQDKVDKMLRDHVKVGVRTDRATGSYTINKEGKAVQKYAVSKNTISGAEFLAGKAVPGLAPEEKSYKTLSTSTVATTTNPTSTTTTQTGTTLTTGTAATTTTIKGAPVVNTTMPTVNSTTQKVAP